MKRLLLLAACALALVGCETIDADAPAKAAMNEAIKAEVPGDYFVGRRMYKKDYKVWGWVRQPGQNWKTAKLVMLNEQKLLAPDRAKNQIGSDNNYEYTLKGYYSGETVYEPASDRFYPEFVVTGFDVRSTNPPIIYTTKRQNDPAVRILMAPQI